VTACARLAAAAPLALLAGAALAGGSPDEIAEAGTPLAAPEAAVEPVAAKPGLVKPGLVKPGPNDVLVTPGVPATLRIARSFINRIVTPFAEFDVWTESPEEFRTRANVFYIAPTSDVPVTLYLTPKDDERLALALTLVPEDVPPAEIHLKLADASGALILPAALGAGPAATAEVLPAPAVPAYESEPHEAAVAELLRAIAAGEVPQGYGPASMTAVHPRCRMVGSASASFARGQRYVGGAYEVFVGVARNDGVTETTFLEEWCAGPDVAAVALWPSVRLGPGAEAEVFVVRRRAVQPAAPERARPSLLRAAGGPAR
jgi:conjugal transfer pilus assembly protein TraK